MTDEPDFIFVERKRKDEFCFAADLNGELQDLEVKIIFVNGKLHEVEEPSLTNVRDQWNLKRIITQMIENAEKRMSDELLPLVKPSSGDSAPGFETEVVSKDELPKGVFEDDESDYYKLNPELVAKERRYWRDPRHRDLSLQTRGDVYGMSGSGLANALLGKSWKAADEIEPPLTRAEYNNALASPRVYGK